MIVVSVVAWAAAFWMVSGGDVTFTVAGAILGYAIAGP